MNRIKLFGIILVFCFSLINILLIESFLGLAYADGEHHQVMSEQDDHMADEHIEADEDLGICPVMRGRASSKYSYVYRDKTYYFCCRGCIEEFKKNPEKYTSKIKEISLKAYQFGFTPGRIMVKKNDIVRLYATSQDVPHGVYIKEYGINLPVKKGEIKKVEFVANKAGEFDIICSVYCGPGHDKMKAKLIVDE